MARLLIYGYSTGNRSSQAIERRCVDDVAFRFLVADQAPDFRSIDRFRRRHLNTLADLFTQSLHLAQKLGMVKMGRVALDGTKLEANASKHKAMSNGRPAWLAKKSRSGLRSPSWKRRPEVCWPTPRPPTRPRGRSSTDGKEVDLPAELDRREKRLARLQAARAQIEAEAADKERRRLRLLRGRPRAPRRGTGTVAGHNFSPHLTTRTCQRVGDWATANNVEIAYTPTNSSWLNRIEAQFTALRYFTLDGTDHATHKEQGSMIRRYII